MTSMSQLNFVDIIILIVFFLSIIVGFTRGLVSELVSLITLIAAFVVALMFSDALAAYFTNTASVQAVVEKTSSAIGTSTAQPVGYIAIGISFALIFIGISIIGAIAKIIINIPFQFGLIGLGNRLFGAGFGLVRGFIINLVLIFLVQISPLGVQPWFVTSKFVQAYQPAVSEMGSIVSPILANLKTRFNTTLQQVNSSLSQVNSSLQGLGSKL